MTTKAVYMATRAAESASSHPAISAAAGVTLNIVAVLQSAQEIMGTLIALVTSVTGLVVAILGLRGALKNNRNKE